MENKKKGHPSCYERNDEIYDHWKNGKTSIEIGKQYGISGSRVRQIIAMVDQNKRMGY